MYFGEVRLQRHGTVSKPPKSMSGMSRHNRDLHTAIFTIHRSLIIRGIDKTHCQ